MKRSRQFHVRWGWPAVAASITCLVFLAQLSLLGGCSGKQERPPSVKKRIGSAEREAPGQQPKETALEPSQESMADTQEAPTAQPVSVDRIRSKRDPFKSFVEIRPSVRTEKASKILTPLQQYKLEQLKVVGIVMGGEVRKALLEDDVGKGYVVRMGDLVGDQEGKIASIEKDRIVVEESYRDVLGEPKMRRTVKRLYSADEGENP